MPGAAPNAAAEATLMMPPAPASRRIGANTWHPLIGPHRLMPRTHDQSSRLVSPMGVPPAPTPALLMTSVGGPLNQACASVANRCTSSIRVTSQHRASARPPSSAIASAVARAPFSSISLHTIRPPRRASSVANAAPMPLPAPVMTASASRLRLSDDPKSPMPIALICRRGRLPTAAALRERSEPRSSLSITGVHTQW
jgi:hypothetical protein